jgi:hypothetical protein
LENTCGFRNGGNCSGLVAGTFEQPDELVTKLSLAVDDQDVSHGLIPLIGASERAGPPIPQFVKEAPRFTLRETALPSQQRRHRLGGRGHTRALIGLHRMDTAVPPLYHGETGGRADQQEGAASSSARSPTRTILTFEVPGGRIGREPLETTKTLS